MCKVNQQSTICVGKINGIGLKAIKPRKLGCDITIQARERASVSTDSREGGGES